MKFTYVIRDPENLLAIGQVMTTIAITGDDGKKAVGITFPLRYFPVLNTVMKAIVRRLNSWKNLPDGWRGKNISVIGIIEGKYDGFKHISKLVEGAELWSLKK